MITRSISQVRRSCDGLTTTATANRRKYNRRSFGIKIWMVMGLEMHPIPNTFVPIQQGTEDGTDCDDQILAPVGAAENDSQTACMKDSDMDGYGDDVSGDVIAGNDCDDDDAQTNPDAQETLDGIVKTVMEAMIAFVTLMVMGLVEKKQLAGFDMDCTDFNRAPEGGDCDDADPNTYPGAAEMTQYSL